MPWMSNQFSTQSWIPRTSHIPNSNSKNRQWKKQGIEKILQLHSFDSSKKLCRKCKRLLSKTKEKIVIFTPLQNNLPLLISLFISQRSANIKKKTNHNYKVFWKVSNKDIYLYEKGTWCCGRLKFILLICQCPFSM